MSTTTRSVIVRLRAEMAQFKKEWADAGREVKKTGDELDKTAKKSTQTETTVGKLSSTLKNNRSEWDLVGSSLLKTGLVLGALSGLVTKAAIDWETAWAGVTKTVDGTPEQLAKIEQGLRQLAKTMPEAHAEIAAVAEAAGQLGVERDNIVEFTRTMVMLGDTTNLSAEEAATSIAQLMNVMQTAPDQVDNLGAALVALGNDGASTERDIIQMAQRIAGAAEIVGLTEGQVLGLANALSSSGIEVEAGGSAMSSVLIDISKAVATNSSELQTWAKVSGMSAQDFAAKWKSAPAEALADFTEGLGRMADSGENVFGTLDKLGQSDIRVTRALLNMANGGDMLRKSLRLGDDALERNTALVAEAEKRYDTTAAKAEIAWNNIKDNAIDAGQAMLPVVSAISDIVVQLADAFGSLPDPVKAGLGVLAGGAGVTLLMAGAFMKAVGTVADLSGALARLNSTSPRTATMMTTIGKNGLIMAAGLTAISVAANSFSDTNAADVQAYTEAILRLGKGGKQANADLEDLVNVRFAKDSLDNLISDIDVNAWRGALNSGLGIIGLNKVDTAEKSVKAWDNALSSLVQDGRLEEAEAGFQKFADAAEKQGRSLEWAKDQFPGYETALKSARREQDEATASFEELSGGSDALAMRLAELSPDAEEAAKALAILEDSTRDAGASFYDFTTDLDATDTSFAQWLKNLEKSRKAQDDWADNMVKAAVRGLPEGLINELEKEGPKAAQLVEEIANASDEDLARIVAAWQNAGDTIATVNDRIPEYIRTQFKLGGEKGAIDAAVKVADTYGLAEGDVVAILKALDFTKKDIDKVLARLQDLDDEEANPKLKLEGGTKANRELAGVWQWLESLDGKSALTTLRKKVITEYEKLDDGLVPKADGGPITGVGGPREDNILIAASVGEHMWTAAEVAAAGGHAAMYAMRARVRAGSAPAFAVGGAVDDAWNESYRSAAAAYGAPVLSVPAMPTPAPSGPSVLGVDVSGVRVGYDRDLRPILQGEIKVAISQNNAYNQSKGR